MKWIVFLLLSTLEAGAEPMLIEDFSDGDAPGWQYVSDRVMGGISDGRARILSEDGQTFARLEGEVSTANNGGFIQMRRTLDAPIPPAATGLKLTLRGNGASYYVHLRPTYATQPWQFFQAPFQTTFDWKEVTLEWTDFNPKGGPGRPFDPKDITSLGIVAYGADYSALLDIKDIALTH